MVRLTSNQLTAICFIFTALPSAIALSAAVHRNLLERIELVGRADLTCTISGYTACNKNGFPGNFCCPSSTECVAFNSGKSAICCPLGKDCSTISPISCDINQQNATAHPSSQLYTTDLTASMQTCGSTCCPIGYGCKNGQCTISTGSVSASAAPASKSSAKPTSTPSKTTSSSPTSSSSSSTAKSTPSHPASSQNASANAHCSSFTVAGVLVGFFAGLTVGVLLTVVVICCFGHQRHKKERAPGSPNFSNVAASVSDPIYQPQDANAFRSDFLRREPNPKSPSGQSRVRSLFSRTPTLRSMRSRDAPVDGIGRSIPPPRTPENQRSPEMSLRSQPSMESIKIYSPPNGGLGRPNTTFTDMMTHAGFKKGEPYLGSPGRGNFRDV